MPLHDFECSACGRQFEKVVRWDREWCRCECGEKAGRVWVARSGAHRQLSEPIVLFRGRDGHYEYPGRNDKKTPRGMERVEIKTHADYSRVMRDANRVVRDEKRRRDEKLGERIEEWTGQLRRDLAYQMGQMNDPWARDFIRHALEEGAKSRGPASSFAEVWNEAMEMNSSNREARWERLNIRGRK